MNKNKIKNKDILKIGTLNCRGLTKFDKKEELVRDINKYNIDILAVQETKIKGISELEQINNYTFYKAECDNSYHGVGFIVKNNIKCNFTGINNRIAKLKVFINTTNIILNQ